jgi:uncharacterized protein YkwD
MRARLALLSLALLLALPVRAQIRPPRMPGFQPVEPVESEVEADIIDQTNAFRAGRGLGGLTENPVLTAEARDFAAFLARTGSVSHAADGRTPGDRARAAGYGYCDVAENIGAELDSHGFRGRRLADDLMRGWEASPGHLRNLLNDQFVEVGVGVARTADRYVAVQEFGRPDTMRFGFLVTNRTRSAVSYAFEGRARTINPGDTVRYVVCSASALMFDLPGKARRDAFTVEPGGMYVLRPDAAGGVRLEVQRRGI